MITRNRALAAAGIIGALAIAAPVAGASAAPVTTTRVVTAPMRFPGHGNSWNHGYRPGYGNSFNHGYRPGFRPGASVGVHAGFGGR